MSGSILTQVPHFDGVHRLPWTTVPRGSTRVEWIAQLGILIECTDGPRVERLHEWQADLQAIEERFVGSKKNDGEVDDVHDGALWS